MEAFDTFVEKWKKNGGETIEKEVAERWKITGKNLTTSAVRFLPVKILL